jgi:hypothetical protein
VSESETTDQTETAPVATEATEAQNTEPKKPEINIPKLLDITGGLLHQAFIKTEKEIGKKRFKELKDGDTPAVGEIKVGKDLEFNVKLALDYSQFVGPGFNFDVYQAFVKGLLGIISAHLKAKKEFGMRTSEQGGVLIDLPVAMNINDQINVMFVIYEFGVAGEITINLSFFDPAQFKQTEPEAE